MQQTSRLPAHELRRLERNIPLFYAFRFLREAQIWIPVWIVFLLIERGFSLTQVGIAEAVFLLSLTVLEVPTGAVADRFGRSISLASGATILVVAIVVFALTTSYAVLLTSFLIWAVADTLMSGADLALVYDSLKALGREDEYEKHAGRGEAFLWAGATLGVLIGAPIAGAVSIQFTIFVGAATTAFGIIVALGMAEPPRLESGTQASYLGGARQAVRLVRRLPAVRTIILYSAVLIAGLGVTDYLIQPFLLDKGQEVGFTFSLLQVPGLLAGVVGALVAFRLIRRLGTVRLLVAIPILGLGAVAGLSLIDELGAVSFMVFALLLRSMLGPITTGYLNRRIPSDQRATVLSFQNLALGLVMAPFSVGIGVIFDELGLLWAFRIPGIALAVLALLSGALWLRAHRREGVHPQDATDAGPPAHSVVAPVLPPHPGDPL